MAVCGNLRRLDKAMALPVRRHVAARPPPYGRASRQSSDLARRRTTNGLHDDCLGCKRILGTDIGPSLGPLKSVE